MKCLVTGGAGFIGSHLSEALVEEDHEVLVVDDLSSGKREQVPSGASLEVHDIRSDEAAATIVRFKPECVFHLAAQMDVRRSLVDPRFDVDVNLAGLVNVVEAARRGGDLERVLFAGSGGAMYGEQEVFPAAEEHPENPTSFYGLAKATGERYLQVFERLYQIPWASMRLANVYGPRQDPHGEAGVVAIFIERLARGAPLILFGGGEQTRDFVFVHDVVRAFREAAAQKLAGPFNVGTARETTVKELATTIAEVMGKDAVLEVSDARPGEQLRSSIDPQKLQDALGFRPSADITSGLRETAEWFTQQ